MSRFLEALQKEVQLYQSSCWASSTKASYATHRRAYLLFCQKANLTPVPASTDTLCYYAAYLARKLRHSSIKQYLNIIRILHLEWGFPNPTQDNFLLQSTMRGIRRRLGDAVHRKAPVTPDMLLFYIRSLDLDKPLHAAMWAAALLMFFALLRKSNVLPLSPGSFNAELHLRRKDISFIPGGAQVSVRWSKTNQFRSRIHTITLPRIPGHLLCPSQALFLAFRLSQGAPPDGPAFVYPQSGLFLALTSSQFIKHFKSSLQTRYDVSQLAAHSFRRGGASWAYQAGVPIDLIRQLGDWRSNAYTLYTLPNDKQIASATAKMAQAL